MRRKTFDLVLTMGGAVLTVVLIAAAFAHPNGTEITTSMIPRCRSTPKLLELGLGKADAIQL